MIITWEMYHTTGSNSERERLAFQNEWPEGAESTADNYMRGCGVGIYFNRLFYGEGPLRLSLCKEWDKAITAEKARRPKLSLVEMQPYLAKVFEKVTA